MAQSAEKYAAPQSGCCEELDIFQALRHLLRGVYKPWPAFFPNRETV